MGDPARIRDGVDPLSRTLARLARHRPAAPAECRARFYWSLQREFAPRPHRRTRWAVATSALAAAAAVMAWALVTVPGLRPTRDATVSGGAASSSAVATRPASAAAGAAAPERTNYWRLIEVPEVGTFEASPESDFRLSALPPEGRALKLNLGLLRAEVLHQDVLAPIAIVTPHLVVEVIGTRLDVLVEPGRTRVELIEGRVRVQGAGGSVFLAAGESVASDDPRFAALGASPPTPTPAAPARLAVAADPKHRVASIMRPAAAALVKPPAPAAPEQVLVTDCDRQDSPPSRERCLRSLAHGDGLAGQNALLSLAMLAGERPDPADALPYLDEYEARFPAGALAAEVALKRIEVLLRSGRTPETLKATRSFAQRFTSHVRAPRVELLRANLLCAEPGGRDEGLEILDRLAGGPDPSVRSDAARLHARCSSLPAGSPRTADDDRAPAAPPGGQPPGG